MGGQPAAGLLVSGERPAEGELLQIAVEAARMAGALLRERAARGAEHEVQSKSTPTDLVSEADLASQRAIGELIGSRRPADGFIGEEEHLAHEGESGLSWVVDPLDGTVNFLFGIPQWCVSVAVRDRTGVIAGAIYDPNRDELFTATRGGPAALTDARGKRTELGGRIAAAEADATEAERSRGRAITATTTEAERSRERAITVTGGDVDRGTGGTSDLATAMVATGLAYDAEVRAAQGRVLERLIPRVRDVRRFGSAALDLAWTAAGRYDAYFERTVKEWDVAAGRLICERAGLRALELEPREGLPWGLLVASPALADQLLEIVDSP